MSDKNGSGRYLYLVRHFNLEGVIGDIVRSIDLRLDALEGREQGKSTTTTNVPEGASPLYLHIDRPLGLDDYLNAHNLVIMSGELFAELQRRLDEAKATHADLQTEVAALRHDAAVGRVVAILMKEHCGFSMWTRKNDDYVVLEDEMDEPLGEGKTYIDALTAAGLMKDDAPVPEPERQQFSDYEGQALRDEDRKEGAE